MLYPSKTQSASQVPAQSASLAQLSTKTHYTPGLCSQLSLSLPPLSTCILHDSLVILNKPNNSPTTHSSDGRLRLASPCDRDIIHLWQGGGGEGKAAAFPRLHQNRAGAEKGAVEPSCVAPQAPFCVYLPLHGTDAIFSSKAQPWLTGPSLFMPFALIMWAGLSAGKVAAIPRVAKWHSGVHWWKGLHACTQGGKATGSLKGTTKRGNVKSSQGENALAYCMSKGEHWHNLWCHTVYLVAHNAWVRSLWRSSKCVEVRNLSVALKSKR